MICVPNLTAETSPPTDQSSLMMSCDKYKILIQVTAELIAQSHRCATVITYTCSIESAIRSDHSTHLERPNEDRPTRAVHGATTPAGYIYYEVIDIYRTTPRVPEDPGDPNPHKTMYPRKGGGAPIYGVYVITSYV